MRSGLARPLSSPGHHLLAAWAALGAVVQACLPPLQRLDTFAGPAALWLWVLPLASLALAWLLAPGRQPAVARQPARRTSRGRASSGLLTSPGPGSSRSVSRARVPMRPAPATRSRVG
ncbi:MAG: hypothetical protein KF823_03700 [Xanthomonadales bacterium]|nr:hypothetical protein [Xanthomonadales bacterium]